MKAKYRRPDGFTLVELLVVIVIIAALAGLSAPVILKQRKAADRTEALNNIKQISTMLFEFDSEYGNFPDNETADSVKEATGTELQFGGTFSNDYFRQLLAGGGGKSEKPFWCKTAQSPKKNATDDFSTQAKALEAGEVGFSYIMASQTKGQSSSGEPNRPVIVTPSYKFQPDWTFDPEPYAGKAVILRLDNSATPMQIRENDKKVSTGQGGKTLGDVGDSTVWGTDMNPVLRAPQPRGGGV
ncbi:prepilin-type N-terminal cleavage/methylation domain-containing protein [Haloferula sp. BvORR071]|uniref:type II secretion system protein n=1 Tax=Haloferula sp. BvORR071 TaxID=1396141 RepID=UPI000696C4A3|nr:prepilin-type N-terminal cleavage/methylation domain-containing protein [Haloferula sp. BvORR071]